MSDASSVAATSMSWVQQAQNNPIDFLKSLDDLLDDFGSQELGNAMTQQFMTKFIQAIREMVNDSDLPCAVKDSANALLDAHDAGVKDDCPCSVEASEAVANTHESHAINQSAEATAGALAETANETSSTPASGASPASSMSPEAQAEADAEAANESPASPASGSSEGADAAQEAADAALNELLTGLGESSDTKKKRGGGGNFLEILAESMGQTQAKFLNEALTHSKTMESLAGNSDKANEFTIAQSKYTAAMQMFNIYSNQVATTLKTLGEAMSAIARKQ